MFTDLLRKIFRSDGQVRINIIRYEVTVMKKSVKALTFAAATVAASLAFGGCVYGPQPTRNTSNAHTDESLPSGYDFTQETEVVVYGPPSEDLSK